MLEMLQNRHIDTNWTSKEIGALIISPTRELAFQISEVLEIFLQRKELSYFRQKLVVGGSSIEEDISAIKKDSPCILICTPGRLEDLFERKGDLNLAGRVKSLVNHINIRVIMFIPFEKYFFNTGIACA